MLLWERKLKIEKSSKMVSRRNFMLLILLQFRSSMTASNSTTSFCKTVTPGHVFNLGNETLLKCYFPIEDDREMTSCKIGNEELNEFPRCVDNAKCVKNPGPSADTTERICVCQKGFKMTSLFTCDPIRGETESCQSWEIKGPFGHTAQVDTCDASMGLKCAEGVCQCHHPRVNGVCVVGAGQECRRDQSDGNGTVQCASHSHCASFSSYESGLGICTCDEGYQSRGRPECRKLLGFGEECDEATGQICDENIGLSCRSGICRCDLPNPDSPSICNVRIGA